MDLCKSVSNNFDECSNQDSICDGGSMERTEARRQIKKYQGNLEKPPTNASLLGFKKNVFLFVEDQTKSMIRKYRTSQQLGFYSSAFKGRQSVLTDHNEDDVMEMMRLV